MADVMVWLTTGMAAVSLLVSVVAFSQSRRTMDRESYVAARDIMTDLTTGETAQARDLFGIVRYGDETGWTKLSYSDVIKQYYVLEWALERVGYGYAGLGPAGRNIQQSIRDALEWHLRELITALTIFHRSFPRDMNDADSWRRITDIQAELHLSVADPGVDEIARVTDRLRVLHQQSRVRRVG